MTQEQPEKGYAWAKVCGKRCGTSRLVEYVILPESPQVQQPGKLY